MNPEQIPIYSLWGSLVDRRDCCHLVSTSDL